MRIAALIFPLLLVSPLFGQLPAATHFIRASGEATVMAKPDRASAEIGVSTHASTAQAASEQNAKQTSQVLNTLRRAIGTSGEVQTSDYTLAPQYEYGNNQPPRLTGYEVNNTLRITVDDLLSLGKIIDAASKSGANNLAGLTFTLKDDTAVRAAVLREATLKARANAEAIAKALNVEVVGVLQAEPRELVPVRPLAMSMKPLAAREAQTTPIESGNIEVHATVTVTLETR